MNIQYIHSSDIAAQEGVREDVFPHILRLQQWVESRAFSGWDPYDALNSPLVRLMSLGTKMGRIAWTQLLRRCPINLRPLLAMPKHRNPKGLGLFLEAFSKLYAQDHDPRWLKTTEGLTQNLESARSPGWSGMCWGYPFDWQSRAALVPADTPNIVSTSFIGHALLDCHEHTGSERPLELALEIPTFFLRHLNRTAAAGAFCFSYTPADHNFVHNANMLGASLLIRLGVLSGNAGWADAARRSMAYSVESQRADGSWPYAETDFQGWIDSFHTGFNLEALRRFLLLGEPPREWQEAFRRGVRYYADHFFLPDGTPKYYHDCTYPIDIHSAAEAVYFFSGEGKNLRDVTEKVLGWLMRNLWNDRKGCFYFRKTRFGTNRIPYMRWSQAWGMRALVEYHVNQLN